MDKELTYNICVNDLKKLNDYSYFMWCKVNLKKNTIN